MEVLGSQRRTTGLDDGLLLFPPLPALLLIIVFSGNLGWTPVSGRIDLLYYFPNATGFMLIDSIASGQDGAFLSALRHLLLPTIVLGTIPLAVIARRQLSKNSSGGDGVAKPPRKKHHC